MNRRNDLVFIVVIFLLAVSCSNSRKPSEETRRYPLKGTVVSVDKDKGFVTVEHGDIPGFMSAMTMPYAVQAPGVLDKVTPGDEITADVVVEGAETHLDNVVVVKRAGESTGAAGESPKTGQEKK